MKRNFTHNKYSKRLTKMAKMNIAIGVIAVSLLLDNGIKFVSKYDNRHNNIVFIDPSVIRTKDFENSLPHNAEIVYLNRKQKGIDQITDYLLTRRNVESVQILSHGNAGYFVLNGEVVDNKFLAKDSKEIISWRKALTSHADIMLYGCKIAATPKGKAFVQKLAELSGADVAAATKETGGVLANWTLDYKVGDIETAALRMGSYEYHLTDVLVTSNGDSGSGTLRQAIADVGTSGGEITFDLSAGNETITLGSQLTISHSMTIDGSNTSGSGTEVTVQADANPNTASYRVFNITGGTVTLEHLKIKNGNVTGSNNGGGIFIDNSGTLSIKGVEISGNTAGHDGGGIFNKGAISSVVNCTIKENTAGKDGGSIYIYDSRTLSSLINSTISGNTASNSGGGIENHYGTISKISNCTISNNTATNNRGGGIMNYGGTISSISESVISGNTSGRMGGGIYTQYGYIYSISNSVISGNTSNYGGGGIFNYASQLVLTNSTIEDNSSTGQNGGGVGLGYFSETTISNTTISGNSSSKKGGGISVYQATLSLSHCTISGNKAANGGGIYQYDYKYTFSIDNTIVANNYKKDGTTHDDFNSYDGKKIVDNGYNIIGISTNHSWTGAGDWTDQDDDGTFTLQGGGSTGSLNLATTLEDNSSLYGTKTLKISPVSIAIEAGTGTDKDQRGAPVYNGERGENNSGTRDIGAYEYNPDWVVWTGETSSEWSTGGNWSVSPTSSPDIGIKADVPYPPAINSSVTANSLKIVEGASLTIKDNGNLTVNSNLTSDGTITIKSDANGTGSLIVKGTESGNINMERYVTAWTDQYHGWHLLSSPVENQHIQPDFVPAPPTTNEDLYSWDEVNDKWVNSKSSDGVWNTSFDNTFITGKGYLAAFGSTQTKTFTGTPNNTDVPIAGLTYTNPSTSKHTGWNLLGNPFPSAVKWGTAAWSLSNGNVDGGAKIWNQTNASYTDISAGALIPSEQGFMVHVTASGTGSLTIPASERVANTQKWYKKAHANTEANQIKLTVYDTENHTAQESIIKFDKNATTGFDSQYDSRFLAGYAPVFYSETSDGPLSTNALPVITEQDSVHMDFIKNASHTFYIKAEGMDKLSPDCEVYLTDLKTNHTQLLNEDSVYYFTAEKGDNPQRFVVCFKPVALGINKISAEEVNVFGSKDNVEIRVNKPIDAKVNVYNITGQLIATGQLNHESNVSLKIYNFSGIAIVNIITSDNVIKKKVVIR